MKSPFDSLGRFPLSIVLSYLSETEGTSLLITRKRYAYQLLPQFRVRDGILSGLIVHGHKRRHHFVVAPVQDPNVLLDRLNTRRLCKRNKRPMPGLSTTEIAAREWRDQRSTTCRSCSSSIAPTHMLLRFLDPNNELQQHAGTLIVSYPRSGNTLLRTLLERVTGIVTGSDTRPDRNLSRELAERHGLVGEGVVVTTTQQQSSSSRVLFVKSHWPERVGSQAYPIKRAVLLVRNPYDAIDSYWNLNTTKSHTQTLTDAVYEQFHDKFERLVRNEIHVWMNFHKYWLGGDECKVPVLVIRFEDLIQNPAAQLERIMKFSLDCQTEELASFWKNRIASVTDESTEKLGSYRPRSGAKSIGKSIQKGRYSAELLDYFRTSASHYPVNYLQVFGYELVQGGFPSTVPPLQVLNTSTVPTNSLSSSIQINVGKTVRPIDCEFGRAMQQWRWSVTDHDKKPLPTV